VKRFWEEENAAKVGPQFMSQIQAIFSDPQQLISLKLELRGGKYSGPLVPENPSCWQKEKRKGRKSGKERKEGKKRKEWKETKKGKKKGRKKERVTAPLSSHFVQGKKKGRKKERVTAPLSSHFVQGKKKGRKKERVTAPLSSHFVQGQTLGVGGGPKIISERTLIKAGCKPGVKKVCLPEIGKFILA
jgi:hypothetical protein